MIAERPFSHPGSKELESWSCELTRASFRRFWVGHLILHRVEALVETEAISSQDRLSWALLGLLASRATPLSLAELSAELSLDSLPQLVESLVEKALLDPAPAGLVGTVSLRGREVLADGVAGPTRKRFQRRSFYFVDSRPPLFLPLLPTAATVLPPPAGWRFDLSVLESCLARPSEWKVAQGFPPEVTRILLPAQVVEEPWKAVPLDCPEQAILVLGERTGGEVVGLSTHPPDWLTTLEPAFRLASGSETLTALLPTIDPEECWQAWLAWAQQRRIPGGEANSAQVNLVEQRLVVNVPPRLLERLRSGKGDPIREEAWILVGKGRVKLPARLEFAPGPT